MEMLHLLLSMPPHFMGSLVLSKLDLSDIVRLDSALLVKEGRPDLHAWYNAASPVDLNYYKYGDWTLKWLLRRSMRVENVSLDWNDHQLVQFVAGNIQHVVCKIHLRIEHGNEARWEEIIERAIPSAVTVEVDDLEVCISTWPSSHLFDMEKLNVRLPFRNLRSICWQRHLGLVQCNCLTSLIRDNSMLCTLHLYGDFHDSDRILEALQERRDTMRSLTLSGSHITHSFLQRISECCTTLIKLTLHEPRAEGGYRSLILGCPLLETISTSHFEAADSSAFLAFALAHGHRLVSIRTDPIPALHDGALLARAPTSAPLRDLTCEWGVTSVTAVAASVHVLSQLTELILEDIQEDSTMALCAALRFMSCLSTVVVSPPADFVYADVLQAAAVGCRRLVELLIWVTVLGAPDSALFDVVCSNPGLQRLDIYSPGSEIKEATLLALAHNCPDLRKLLLRCDVRLTDAIVATMAHRCCKLAEWDVGDDSDLTDASVLALVDHCRDLQVVFLPNATQVREQTVVHLIRSCKKLSNIRVSADSLSQATLAWIWQEVSPLLTVNFTISEL